MTKHFVNSQDTIQKVLEQYQLWLDFLKNIETQEKLIFTLSYKTQDGSKKQKTITFKKESCEEINHISIPICVDSSLSKNTAILKNDTDQVTITNIGNKQEGILGEFEETFN